MATTNFRAFGKADLIRASLDTRLGIARALAIDELASRALADPTLQIAACVAISSDRSLGDRSGPPLGWLGADRVYLAGRSELMAALLKAMNQWSAAEQGDLMIHWAGAKGAAALSAEFAREYGWTARSAG